MESSLADLVLAEVITYEDALNVSGHPKDLGRLMANRGAVYATA